MVIHVGCGEWIIVDSCAGESAGHPSKPIEYLKNIGHKPEECVRIVVATHWHDDHIAGLSEALDMCQKAVFCCSIVLSGKEFIGLADL
ncbi:MAG: MBL fold metallo-hydrolase [Magnetococcales bacterium]|nr:MBL fold metallo-hydrolase [Magnetococcales bacterium]